MSVTQKPLPGADSQHFLAISYPLDWEKTQFLIAQSFLLKTDARYAMRDTGYAIRDPGFKARISHLASRIPYLVSPISYPASRIPYPASRIPSSAIALSSLAASQWILQGVQRATL